MNIGHASIGLCQVFSLVCTSVQFFVHQIDDVDLSACDRYAST